MSVTTFQASAGSHTASRAAAKKPPTAASKPADQGFSLFHEPWWLTAATGGQYREATVTSGEQIVGRLPYVFGRAGGLTTCRMPPFTHVLGPVVRPGAGKPQTVLLQRLSIIRELIDQLPKVAFFKQALASSLVDGLAFQERGFQVTAQYTFQIDCREHPDTLWGAMNFKARQHIRRAEEKLEVSTIDDPQAFIDFYLDNIRRSGRRSFIDFTTFPALFAAAREHQSGEILCASWPGGKPAAMVVFVWGHGRMYYLLSTRARDQSDNGSINLLLWEGFQRAHSRGLVCDLDGVSTSGTARFLSGFGGHPELRLIVQQTSAIYAGLRKMKRCVGWGRGDNTFAFT